ncbi:MAG: hypothetical protein MI919_19630 [Holophagales bacterium]|nr:hypothetical protein [Holophagales bacterium]
MSWKSSTTTLLHYLDVDGQEALVASLAILIGIAMAAAGTIQSSRTLEIAGVAIAAIAILAELRKRIRIESVKVFGLEVNFSVDALKEGMVAAAERADLESDRLERILHEIDRLYEDRAPVYVRRNGDVHIQIEHRMVNIGAIELSRMAGELDLGKAIPELEQGGRKQSPPPEDVLAAPTIHRPGTRVVDSGIYDVVDRHGTYLNHQVVCVEGKRRTFPSLTDPRAFGYVLRRKTRHIHPPENIYTPGRRVAYSGIYDVVDKRGKYLGHQKTCAGGDLFPPMKKIPHGYGYVLAERAVHMARIYLAGQTVESSGVYDLVDKEGLSIGKQVECRTGKNFPTISDPDGYGYMFRREVVEHATDIAGG